MTGFLKAAQINNWHVGVCRPIFMPHSLDIDVLAQSQLPSVWPPTPEFGVTFTEKWYFRPELQGLGLEIFT